VPATTLDENELWARVRRVMPGHDVGELTALQGGVSSLTYWATVTVGGRTEQVVVKVAPPGLEPTKNRDVLRQSRLLEALGTTPVPVPRVLAEDPGAPPEVPPFFVMSFEAGECIEPSFLPPGDRPPPEEVRDRELHAARVLGHLHAVDPEAVGFGAEPPTTLDAEVERWMNSFAACEDDLRLGSEDVGERLRTTTPSTGSPVLLHGDYRLGNTLSLGHRVVSVIDWEIWSRGDPRVDLAWFLMMANPDPALGRPTAEGMPSDGALLSAYEETSGGKVSDLEWFAGLVRYKQAAASALIIRNSRRRGREVAPVDNARNPLLVSARHMLGLA